MHSLLVAVVTFVPAADPVRFTAAAAGADPRTGQLVGLAADGAVTLAEPDATVPAGNLVALRRAGRPLPAWPREPQVILANGDRIAGTVLGGTGQNVRFRPALVADGPDAEPWSVPLSALAAVWFAPPPGDTPPDPARYPWRDPARRQDTVLLRNRDTATGTVEGVSADGSALQLAGERAQPARPLELARVAGVAFDPSLTRVRKPKGLYYRVVTAAGSRVSAATLTADANTLTGTTLFGAKFALPLADVAAITVLQGKAAYLSDLKPKKAVAEGYNGVSWPWAADRSVRGLPLRLPGDGWFDKGLGTHPRTTLTYDLGGKYGRFEAWVGLDPATGRRGSAVVRVLVDGKEVSVPGLSELTAATSPVAVRADVAGAKALTLVVDYGPTGDVQADVNWAAARLVE